MEMNRDEVFAVVDGEKTYHLGCVGRTFAGPVKEKNILSRDEIDNDVIYFCDECGELIE